MSKIHAILICILLVAGFNMKAEPRSHIRTISDVEADSLSRQQVFYRNRIVPFHTVAKDITLKITGQTKVGSLDPVKFVASLMLYPRDWAEIPLIKIKDRSLLDSLGIRNNSRIALSQLFDQNNEYILRDLYQATDTKFDKAILDLDEKVEIILLLRTNSLFTPINDDRDSLSPALVSLEIFYNKISLSRWLFIGIFVVATVAFFLIYYHKATWTLIPYFILSLITIFNFVAVWIIGAHIPLTGGEQVMMFMTMLLLILATIFSFKIPWIGLGALVMGGFTALVARISASDPIVTALSPALASPWLAFHVSVIMASYAVFAIMLPISLISEFINSKKANNLLKPQYILNIIGVALLAIGIVLGSLWAKSAWGSYWSWDPKENWAAITFFAYLIPLSFKRYIFSKPKLYNAFLIGAFVCMVITYYGVNYMSSLHSYGT